jgi:hypothetical protein
MFALSADDSGGRLAAAAARAHARQQTARGHTLPTRCARKAAAAANRDGRGVAASQKSRMGQYR